MGFFDPFGVVKGAKSFFSPDEPYKAAEDAARKYYEEAQGYGKPYYQRGLDQYGNLMGAEGKLLDPAALEAEWAKSYETSPYAQRMLDMNTQAGLEAASSMGLMGSSGALSNIQRGAGDIVARDRQQFLEDLMQKYLAGIGLGRDIYGTGAEMGRSLMEGAGRMGENMAQYEYGRKAAPGVMFENLMKTGGSLFGMSPYGQQMFPGYKYNPGKTGA